MLQPGVLAFFFPSPFFFWYCFKKELSYLSPVLLCFNPFCH